MEKTFSSAIFKYYICGLTHMTIFILGAGNLGSALAKVLSVKNDIILYDINRKVVDEINSRRTNKRYMPGVKLGKNISATTDISKSKGCEIIILAVPSKVERIACETLKPHYNGQLIISASKGLSKEGLVLTDIVEHVIKCPRNNILSFSGPCIAKELAHDKPTLAMLGGSLKETRKAKRILETSNLYLKTTTDRQGIQLLGFYKNIIAILVGICDGLELGKNFEASLVSKAFDRFYHLNAGKNIKRHTFTGPAGLGDLYVTAMSPHSRNRTFGYLIGKGLSIEKAMKRIGQTVEGYDNLLLLRTLREKSHIDHDLVMILTEIIHKNNSKDDIKEMLLRYLRMSKPNYKNNKKK
jgi:glycerol-3-phosphate dehydrogenase (NAD(P)+)